MKNRNGASQRNCANMRLHPTIKCAGTVEIERSVVVELYVPNIWYNFFTMTAKLVV